MAKKGKKMSLGGIALAVAVTGAAWLYNKNTAASFQLSAEYEPASDQVVRYRYIKKTKDYSGNKRHADCYILSAYKNKAGQNVDSRCVKEYERDSICAYARRCEKMSKDEP